MTRRARTATVTVVIALLIAAACTNPQAWPAPLTPIPSLAPAVQPTLMPVMLPATASTNIDAAQGSVYYGLHCTPCHGAQAEGVIAPPLRNSQFIQTEGNVGIYTTIANGVPNTIMPAWLHANGGALNSTQIQDIIAYLMTLQGVSTVAPATLEPSPTPEPNITPEPAMPSAPGGPGQAASLTGNVDRGQSSFGAICSGCHGPEGIIGVPNPGSDDGQVPSLNPIDPTIANPDPAVFAVNVDRFVEHGSVPSGSDPAIVMPDFGDSGMLNPQQLADLIAYVMYLNGVQASK